MHSLSPTYGLLRSLAAQRGTDLDAWVRQLRDAGASWRAIGNLIEAEYGTAISLWTLRRWYADIEPAKAAA